MKGKVFVSRDEFIALLEHIGKSMTSDILGYS